VRQDARRFCAYMRAAFSARQYAHALHARYVDAQRRKLPRVQRDGGAAREARRWRAFPARARYEAEQRPLLYFYRPMRAALSFMICACAHAPSAAARGAFMRAALHGSAHTAFAAKTCAASRECAPRAFVHGMRDV